MIRHRLPGIGAGALLFVLAALPACAQQDPATLRSDAVEAGLTGRYDEALSRWRRLATSDSARASDRRNWIRLLIETGRGGEAVAAARRLGADDPALATVLGEALRATGHRAAAESAWVRALASSADDRAVARVNLGEALADRGDRRGAGEQFAAVISSLTRRETSPTAEEYVALGTAYRHLGADDPSLFREALAAYDRAIAARPVTHEARIRLGELFLDKFNGPDAAATFREVLAVNPRHARALLGKARHAWFDGADSAYHYTRMALEANPSLPDAHAFLARLELEAERYPEAAAEAAAALKQNPEHLPALAMLAASRYLLTDDAGYAAARDTALRLNPRNAEFHADLAEAAGRNRLYQEAHDFADQAVRLDPRSWRALALRGTNALRLGRMEEGRRDLEDAFRGDPFNLWTKNTLDLLDHLVAWPETRSARDRFRFVIDSAESDLLTPYIAPLAEEAFDSLAARYQYAPPTPVRLEIYGSHADFSVRTVGLAGLGALGVSFGSVLAMDSPSARDRGDFNWGSTFWHELGHAFTLGMSGHRVPRWFSEGLSVLEERRARPAWGARANPGFLAVLKADRLLPVSRMNDGFMRPSYPGQIIHAYYQASLVCEYIEDRWGMEAIRAMLMGYRDRKTTPELVPEVLGVSEKELDDAFDSWIKERFATELQVVAAAPGSESEGRGRGRGPWQAAGSDGGGELQVTLAAALARYREKDLDGAEVLYRRAIPMWPEYAGPGNAYTGLALIHRDRGNPAEAIAMLSEVTRRNEVAWEENLLEADLRAATGDTLGAAAALERTLWIRPGDPALHARLAEWYQTIGNHSLAVRERRSVLALGPVDRADAEFQLARALEAAGDGVEARRAVLRALEIAPTFGAAQDLLLRLRGAGRP